jgi:hypothetical protein
LVDHCFEQPPYDEIFIVYCGQQWRLHIGFAILVQTISCEPLCEASLGTLFDPFRKTAADLSRFKLARNETIIRSRFACGPARCNAD